jgi:NAD(P)-dependent dehydrogenase (short-subunit alcohol dehydrogenase family)
MSTNPWGMQTALVPVTGAASGIGLAICKRLRAEGATPLMLDNDGPRLERAVHEVFPEASAQSFSRYIHVVDVRDSEAVDACFAQMRRVHGPVTHAVANAGTSSSGHILDVTDDEWRRVMDINLNGAFFFCRAAARHLAEMRRGAIVAIASIAGIRAKQDRVAYASSKAAVINMVRALALDLGRFGVRVNGVAPGIIQTPMQEDASAASLEQSKNRTALGRLGTAEEVSNLVLFLLSDQASFITGETVLIDGGLTARYN